MKIELTRAFAELEEHIKSDEFVRAVLSGRRRNMAPSRVLQAFSNSAVRCNSAIHFARRRVSNPV